MPPDLTRRSFLWLLPASAGASLAAGMTAEGFEAHISDGRIRVAAPRLRFVLGKSLERLKNGAPVPFAVQLTLSTDRWATVQFRDIQRFVFSYDLWEEKFAVTRMGAPRRSISHLTARGAEEWCVEEMSLPSSGLGRQQSFWLRLEVRAENPAEQAELDRQDPMSLTRLIDIFSRRVHPEETRSVAEVGPVSLAALRKVGNPS